MSIGVFSGCGLRKAGIAGRELSLRLLHRNTARQGFRFKARRHGKAGGRQFCSCDRNLLSASVSTGEAQATCGRESHQLHHFMTTRIVHCQKEKYDVYIGRANSRKRLTKSIFSNPYVIGKDGTRREVLDKYRAHAEEMVKRSPMFALGVRNLHGKTIACWCLQTPVETIRPREEQECHGEILAEIALRLFLENEAMIKRNE